jgi:hypothetical protein
VGSGDAMKMGISEQLAGKRLGQPSEMKLGVRAYFIRSGRPAPLYRFANDFPDATKMLFSRK